MISEKNDALSKYEALSDEEIMTLMRGAAESIGIGLDVYMSDPETAVRIGGLLNTMQAFQLIMVKRGLYGPQKNGFVA